MTAGWTPPPYPRDTLAELSAIAAAASPAGLLDLSVGDPCDPLPAVVADALRSAIATPGGYPPSIGRIEFREAASAWMQRRLDVDVPSSHVIACVGTKEFVAWLPHLLHRRNPARDTVLFPAVAYPTYDMGAQLAGIRAVPVPLDDEWLPDIGAISDSDAERALVLWLNQPSNPTGSVASNEWYARTVAWARERGVVVANDECYAEFVFEGRPTTALSAGLDGVIAVHSLSKRSNMTGIRCGFAAGDPDLIGYLGEARKHAGFMVPGIVQAAATTALGDDAHVDEQRERYAERRKVMLDAVEAAGLPHDGGPATFYLWVHDASGAVDGDGVARRFAEAGALVMPGGTYGSAGVRHARLALVHPVERLREVADRL